MSSFLVWFASHIESCRIGIKSCLLAEVRHRLGDSTAASVWPMERTLLGTKCWDNLCVVQMLAKWCHVYRICFPTFETPSAFMNSSRRL
jgi:hypothetical protein